MIPTRFRFSESAILSQWFSDPFPNDSRVLNELNRLRVSVTGHQQKCWRQNTYRERKIQGGSNITGTICV